MTTSRSPLAGLPRATHPVLYVLGAITAVRACALIVIAQALATGIVSVIAENDRWQSSITWGVGALLVRALCDWLSTGLAERAVHDTKAALRRDLAHRALARGGRDLPVRPGEMATLATRGLDDLDAWFTQYLPALVTAIALPVLVLARIAWADWISGVVIILTLPLIPVFMALIGYRTRDRVQEAADGLARLANHLVELARGLPVLVGLGRANAQEATLREISDSVRTRTMGTLRIAFLSSLALELIATISVAVVAVFIGLRLVHGSLDLETGLFVLILAPECYTPFRRVGAAFHASDDGREALARVRRLLEAPLSRLLASDGENRHISVRNLTVRYASRVQPVVDNLSFDVQRGSVILLDGPSGSGKTTVASVLTGLLGTNDSTSIGGDIAGLDRERVAWLPQHPVFFAESVAEEIALASGSPETGHLLDRVNAGHLAMRHPSELSPGETRRVAFARVLARIERGASVVILDEPTAHLDDASIGAVLAEIRRFRPHVATLLIGHDARLRAIADAVVPVGDQAATGTSRQANPTPDPAPLPTGEADNISQPPGVSGSAARTLGAILEPVRRSAVIAIAFGMVATLAAVALAAVSGWLIVRASEQPPILYLLVAIVGVRLCGIGRAVARYAERLWLHDTVFVAMTELRTRVWHGLAAQGPAAGRLLDGSETLTRLVGDIDRLRDLTARVLPPPATTILAAVAGITAAILVAPQAGAVSLAAAVICLVGIPALLLELDRRSESRSARLRSDAMRIAARLHAAASDIRANGMAEAAMSRLGSIDARLTDLDRRSAWLRGTGEAGVVFTLGAASFALLSLASGLQISGGYVAALVLAPLAFIDPALAHVEAVRQWPALRHLADRFDPLLRACGSDSAGREPLARVGSIELDNLAAQWPGRVSPVFSGVSATASRGEWLAVTGPSGSGKSTLLALLLGFLQPNSGHYRINGRDAGAFATASIRDRIAWCPQEAHLFDSTLRANLLVARDKTEAPTEWEMRAVLIKAGLGDLLGQLPEGLDTPIGPRGSFLSGGQRQRLAVARTLLTRADVILLDEPTAHLDRATADDLMADLRASLRDKLVILVTHDPADIAPADQVLQLGPAHASRSAQEMMARSNTSAPALAASGVMLSAG